jgi:hypothetical protein
LLSTLTTLTGSTFGYTIDSTFTSLERELLGSTTIGVLDLDTLVGLAGVSANDYLKSTFYGVGLTSAFAGVGLTIDLAGVCLTSVFKGVALTSALAGVGFISAFAGVGLTSDFAGVGFTSDFPGVGLTTALEGVGFTSFLVGLLDLFCSCLATSILAGVTFFKDFNGDFFKSDLATDDF